MSIPQIILASQSLQRQHLLTAAGIPFTVVPANLDEKAIADPRLEHRAESIAIAKAQHVARQYPAAIIIAADTFLVLEERILEKPQSLTEAREMLQFMSGQTVVAHSGVYYSDPAHQVKFTTTVKTPGTLRSLTTTEIEYYVTNNKVLTWAGGFSPAYDAGMGLMARIDGSLTNFTHGFPMEVILPLLQASMAI